MKEDQLLIKLEEDIKHFLKEEPHLKHFLLDPFNDHKKRYKITLEVTNKYFKGGKILDIGANPFHLTYCYKKLGYDVIGLDINPAPFKKFIFENKLNIKKVNIEIQKLPFKDNSFDLIIFSEVFEHLRVNPILTLHEINRVLKPQGTLVLTTPNLYALHKIIMFNLGMSINDAYDEFEKLYKYGYIGHFREYSTREIKKFLEKTDFYIKEISYQNYYSFFKYPGFKNSLMRLGGLIIDLLMIINPYWRRHQIVVARKSQ